MKKLPPIFDPYDLKGQEEKIKIKEVTKMYYTGIDLQQSRARKHLLLPRLMGKEKW